MSDLCKTLVTLAIGATVLGLLWFGFHAEPRIDDKSTLGPVMQRN